MRSKTIAVAQAKQVEVRKRIQTQLDNIKTRRDYGNNDKAV